MAQIKIIIFPKAIAALYKLLGATYDEIGRGNHGARAGIDRSQV